MSLEATLQELRSLIDTSAGSPITLPSGATRSFRQKRVLNHADVRAMEQARGAIFPPEYATLLTTVGAAECFVDAAGRTTLELHDPDEVPRRYGDLFASPADLRRFLPVALDHRLQEIVVLLLERPGPRNVLVVSHEVPPEDWLELADEVALTSIEAWMREVLASEGELRPH